VFQALPRYGLSAEGLWVSLVTASGEIDGVDNDFSSLSWILLGIHPDAFDADP